MNLLAAQAGLSQQMVSYVERGMRKPTLDTIFRMSAALDISFGGDQNVAEIVVEALQSILS